MKEMTKRRTRLWWMPVLVLLCAAGEEAYAHAFRNPPAGAQALSLSGGKTVWIDDASAVSHNPANLADIEDVEVLASVTMVYGKTEYKTPWGVRASTREPWKMLPNFFAAWPLDEWPAVLGIGLTTPYGQSTEWRPNAPFSAQAPYYARMRLVDVNPTLAGKIGDRVMVGVGIDLYWSDMEMRQVIPWSAATGIPGLPDGEARIKSDDTALGGNAALTWRLHEQHRLALVYRSGFTMDYSGDVKIGNIPPPLAGMVFPESRYRSEFKFPSMVSIGYGIQAHENLTLGFDIEWIEFSRFRSMPIDVGRNAAVGLFPDHMPQELRDVWTAGLSAGWHFSPQWAARIGYQYLESPVPGKTHSPLLPDADKHVLTFGVGFQAGANILDLAYAYTIFEDREVDHPANPVPGSYDLTSHLLSFNFRRSF